MHTLPLIDTDRFTRSIRILTAIPKETQAHTQYLIFIVAVSGREEGIVLGNQGPLPPTPTVFFPQLVILAAVVLLAYQLEYTDTFPVHVQGFFCYDSTYAKPYPGPEEASRAPPVLVYSLVTAGPTLTVTAASGLGELGLLGTWGWGSVYSFGLFTTTIFANAGQVVTGNPTPHFLSVCRPNYTALGCQPPTTHYVTDLGACAGNPLLVTAARKAFPSKDAALCAYAVVYTMYVTLVFKLKGSRLAKPSVCLALLCPAFLVGVVRVAEYRNHWSDVLAGFLTGGAIATFLVTCVVNKFQSQRPAGRRGALPESLGTKPTMALPCVDSPLEKLSVAQVRGSCPAPQAPPAS
uniref:Phospholipid phosphatase related 2 n=1 Tax=Ornithorhynchus anatinus TaxID=9258 RepID=A0A6I8PI67_ORNAN